MRKPRVRWILIIAIITLVVCWPLVRHHSKSGKVTIPHPVTAVVTSCDLTHLVSCSGQVEANREIQIKCKATGQIVTLPFLDGDPVKKGDLLVELNPDLETRHVRQTQLELDSSQARLEQAKATLAIAQSGQVADTTRARSALLSAQAKAEDARMKSRRSQTLLDKKLVSHEEAEAAELARVEAEGELADARSHIEELPTLQLTVELRRQDVALAATAVEANRLSMLDAQQRLQETRVLAPIDGIIVGSKVQVGQIISGVGEVTGGTEVMSLADLSQVYALGSVDESQIGQIEIGQKAELEFDSFPDQVFEGVIRRIAPEGVEAAGNIVTFQVKVEVVSANRIRLRPKMTATVDIHTGEVKQALTVPMEAIIHKKGKTLVMRQKPDGTTEEREVTIGLDDGTRQQVLTGLAVNEIIVVQDDGPAAKTPGGE